ncbi:MAG TPA: hypothetical protein VJ717_02190 [Gemmatimonadaceae bacterium]|nr:hypothetical protein [Gemmatimonadaceae bacterium]
MASEKEKKEGPLPPPRDHKIRVGEAIELVRRYRRYAGPAAERGGFFWAEPIRKLLARKGVVGLRYYHGVDENGGYRIILVGVDKDGKDVVRQIAGTASPTAKGSRKGSKTAMALSTEEDDGTLQNHFPCPPFCPTGGPFA